MITKFEYQEILDAIPTAAEQYSKYDNKGNLERSSVDLAWSKVAGICRTRRLEKKKPYIRDLFYIRGILRSRVYVNEGYIMDLMESAVNAGVDVEDLKYMAKRCSSWTDFRTDVEAKVSE